MKLFIYTYLLIQWILIRNTSGIENTGSGALIDLTNNNYNQFREDHNNETILTLFYSPWCYLSQHMIVEYAIAANLSSKQYPDVHFTQVNAFKESEVSQTEDIRSFPTLKMFIYGEPIIYTGPAKSTGVIHWLEVISNRDKIITSLEQLHNLVSHSKLTLPVMIGSFPSIENWSFGAVAKVMGENVFFGEIRDQNISNDLFREYADQLKNHSPENPIIFSITNFENPNEQKIVVYTGNINDVKAIENFVKVYRLPPIVPMAKEWYTSMYTDGRPILIFVYEYSQKDQFEKHQPIIQSYQEQYKDSIIFSSCFDSSSFEKRMINILGLEDESLPVMRIMMGNMKSSTLSKFKPNSSAINSETIKNFVDSFLNHELKSYVRSEIETLEDPSDPVKTVVGDNFDDIVRNHNNDVLVMFHAPWCGHCREFLPIYTEVARLLKSTPNVIIAKIDATVNEVRDIDLAGYPTVLLFKATKDHYGIEYNGHRTVKNILSWLASKTVKAKFNPETLLQNIDATLPADYIEL